MIEQNPGQFRNQLPSYIVILRSFSSRVFHFFFSEELSVTNQVPKSIEIARRINFIIFVHRQTENLSRVIKQNPFII